MEKERVHAYYSQLRDYYLKPDSDWSDKAKALRTIAHKFYNELTSREGTFCDALKEFYRANNRDTASMLAFKLKNELNGIVHDNVVIDKSRYVLFYTTLVNLMFLATDVMPDDATLDYLGFDKSDVFEGLNEEQRDAVLCPAKRIFVNAGPGTGKTYLIVNKLVWYVSSSSKKERIVALSFTNTAADELGEKFRRILLKTRIEGNCDFYNGTIHSFCFRMLRSYAMQNGEEFNYLIIDDEELKELEQEVGHPPIPYGDSLLKRLLTGKYGDRTESEPMRSIDELKRFYKLITIPEILSLFLDRLEADRTFKVWLKEQITILVVDESQDLSKDHYRIFEGIVQANPELDLFFVGDPRQNIFRFGGGSFENMKEFQACIGSYEEKVLSGTYRCPNAITAFVNRFSFTDCGNPPLVSFRDGPGSLSYDTYCDIHEEVVSVLDKFSSSKLLWQNSAILARSLKYLVPFVDELNKRKIPYRVLGGTKTVKPHIRTVNHVLKIILNGNRYSLERIARQFSAGSSINEFYKSEIGFQIQNLRKRSSENAMTFQNVVSGVIDMISLGKDSESVADDYKKLIEIAARYSGIDDYLSAFVIDRDTFSQFYEKVSIRRTTCGMQIQRSGSNFY